MLFNSVPVESSFVKYVSMCACLYWVLDVLGFQVRWKASSCPVPRLLLIINKALVVGNTALVLWNFLPSYSTQQQAVNKILVVSMTFTAVLVKYS